METSFWMVCFKDMQFYWTLETTLSYSSARCDRRMWTQTRKSAFWGTVVRKRLVVTMVGKLLRQQWNFWWLGYHSLRASDVGNDFVACRQLWTTSTVFGTCSLGSLEKYTMHTFLGTCHCFRKVCKDSFSPRETNKWCRCSNTFNKATAFPLLPWLMKPFTDNGHLNAEEVHFNDTASQDAKSTLELFAKEKFMPTLIGACCTLHNLCEQQGAVSNVQWFESLNVACMPTQHLNFHTLAALFFK